MAGKRIGYYLSDLAGYEEMSYGWVDGGILVDSGRRKREFIRVYVGDSEGNMSRDASKREREMLIFGVEDILRNFY